MPSTPDCVAVAGGEMARDGLKTEDDGNIVGREGPRRDVKVLGVLAGVKIQSELDCTSLPTASTPTSPLFLRHLKL